MPQFVMNKGTRAREFDALDSFTRGYIEAIFFTECTSERPEIEFCNFVDLAPKTLARIMRDCVEFQDSLPRDGHGRTALDLAYDYATVDYDAHRAGVDFWFTRCGHGAGFWDRKLGEIGDELSEAAHAAGELDLCLGDDEKLYLI